VSLISLNNKQKTEKKKKKKKKGKGKKKKKGKKEGKKKKKGEIMTHHEKWDWQAGFRMVCLVKRFQSKGRIVALVDVFGPLD